MSDLYRIHIGPGWVSDPMDVVNDLIDEGVLVPVERCEHGNVYPHQITEVYFNERLGDNDINVTTCPGAGIGGDDED